MLHEKYEIEGWFRIEVKKAKSGEVVRDTGWFKNLITNYGMNQVALATSCIQGCTVGTGTTPENVNDTQIQVFRARSNTVSAGSHNSPQVGSTVAPYYSKVAVTYRFAEGAASGNLTEVGIIATPFAAPYNLWSRTLIKDSSGNPTVITILSDEILDVSYECRVYPQANLTTGTVTLMGNSHTFTLGCSQMNTNRWGQVLFGGLRPNANSTVAIYAGTSLSAAPEQAASGAYLRSANNVASLDSAYVTDSFTINVRYNLPPGTVTGEIGSIDMTPSGGNSAPFGLSLNPQYNKLATVEMRIVVSTTWSRRAV